MSSQKFILETYCMLLQKIPEDKEEYGDKWNIPLEICDKEKSAWIKNEDYYRDK